MYWERIDPATANMLQTLSGTGILRDFYLSGGTALSLQIGHRVSVDLDFFTKKAQSKLESQSLFRKLEERFKTSTIHVSYRSIDQIWLDLNRVRVTFMAYPFQRKYPLVEQNGVEMADIRDIALQKAYVIGRRTKARDYVDLACILRSGVISLGQIALDASEVFVEDGERLFNRKLFLQQIVYTDGLDDADAVLNQLHQKEPFDVFVEELASAVRLESFGMFKSQESTNTTQRKR